MSNDSRGKRAVAADGAPRALGPYSQAIASGDFVFCSGQIPLDPATGELVAGDFRAQAERVLANLEAVLAAAGATFADVVRATVFLVDLADFAELNEAYSRRFVAPFPARVTVQVAALPKGSRVEIDAIAIRKAGS